MVFPVETIVREFDGKLLLALCARERGWKVMIGDLAALIDNLPHLPPCVFFAKSARSANSVLFARLKALGHDVVVLDEEALVTQSNDIYLMKHEKDALENVDLILTWGPENTALWRNSDMLHGVPADEAGNPRIDMLLPGLRSYHDREVADIRQRFGEYVLFNSNFATVNSAVIGGNRFNLAGWVPEDRVARETDGLLGHKRVIFQHFRDLMPKIAAAIAPRQLVIRPHPSENHAVWRELAADLPNASVVFEGSVVPWIAGASVLIHNGCTSAVEAAIAGTPVLTYRPAASATYDNPLANSVGRECFSDDELLEALAQTLQGDPPPLNAAQQALLARHVTVNASGLCCDAIMAAIDRHGIGKPGASRRTIGVWLDIYAKGQKRRLSKALKLLTRAGRSKAAYRARKFPGITADNTNQRIARYQATLSRFSGIKAREVRRNVLEIFD